MKRGSAVAIIAVVTLWMVSVVALKPVATPAEVEPSRDVPRTPAPVATTPPAPDVSAWRVTFGTAPMDDSEVVVLRLDAKDTYRDWIGDEHRPTLVLRCQSGETEAYIVNGGPADPELGKYNQATIRLRLDAGVARQLLAGESTDGEALFLPEAVGEIRRMIGAERLRYQFTPFNANPQVVEFDLRGLEEKVEPLREACEWDDSRRVVEERERRAEEERAAAEEKRIADEAARERNRLAVLARRQREEAEQRLIAALMPEWHPTYRREIAPVRNAVGNVQASWSKGSNATPECADLEAALAHVDRGALEAAPDPALASALSRLLVNFDRGAAQCVASRRFHAESFFAAATKEWAEVVRRLRLYGLQP